MSMATLGHISSVGAELMKTEVQLYEKGKESAVLHMENVTMGGGKMSFQDVGE